MAYDKFDWIWERLPNQNDAFIIAIYLLLAVQVGWNTCIKITTTAALCWHLKIDIDITKLPGGCSVITEITEI